jgi:2-octaprenyl-6-methoxyphenol hydroxylase
LKKLRIKLRAVGLGLTNFDIIVVGAGINGMTTASVLSEKGFKVALIERDHIKKKLKTNRDGRGISIARNSKDILSQYNIWEHISSEYGTMEKIIVTDGGTEGLLEFDNQLVGGEPLGYLIESDNILKGLCKKIFSSDITILDGKQCKEISAEGHSAKITLEGGETIESKSVIVTNGRQSGMASELGLESKSKKYNQVALVFNVEHAEPHNNSAYECFLKNGPFALLPLHNRNQSSVVWCEDPAILEMDIYDVDLEDHLKRRCGDIYSDVKILTEVSKFPLSLSHMDHYYKGRSVFIGDSLHFIHPVAGQGYNLSLKDIDTLACLFEKHRDLGLDLGSEILFKEFQCKRKRDNKSMIRTTDSLVSLFSNDISIPSICRRVGLQVVDNIPTLKKFFMRKAMGY